MKIKKSNLVIFILLIGISNAQYRDLPEVVDKVATSAANWLKLGTSVRAAGMGGAQVALGQGINSTPFNPASLAFVKGKEAYFSRTNYLVDITYNVISFGSRVTTNDYVGFNLFYLDSGPMAVTREDFPNGTGEEFNVISLAMRMSYARVMTDRLKIGMTLNYIRDEIYTTNMQSVAFDIGSNFDTGILGFILGMSVSNFGPEVQYQGEGLQVEVPDTLNVDEILSKVTDKFPLPLIFRMGISNNFIGSTKHSMMKSKTHRLTLALDAVNPSDYSMTIHTGGEYAFKELAFLRSGIRIGHDTAGLSVGAGISVKTGGLNINVDYAFVDYGILKFMHQVGLGLEF